MERLIAFVNTRDVDAGTDDLGSPSDLKAWLVQHDLVDPAASVGAGDLERAKTLREGLRSALLAHDVEHAASNPAQGVVAAVPLQLVIAADGAASLGSATAGVDGALAALVSAIPAAVADGTWQRAKACPQGNCQWAFFDQSRNRSRRWCSMEVCGNREKTRSFRKRMGTT